MMITFRLPDLGEGLQEAEIVSWHVSQGDHVVMDQPLLSVETDKAVVEIPSPLSGRVLALHAASGDLVPTDAPLVDIETEVGEDSGTVVGVLPSAAPVSPTSVSAHRPARWDAAMKREGLVAPLVLDRALATEG